MLFRQLHFLRLAHELVGQPRDAFRVSGREQHGLALGRALLHHERDVVVEAHVQHAVGFVQHQRVERIQLEAAAFDVVHDAARRADDDMRAVLQAVALRPHGGAADQRQYLDVVGEARQAAHLLRHLVGQFARRAQHHGLHGKAARVELGEQRQRECRGLAAAGLGLRDEVVSGQRDRQALRLDRRHRAVFQLLQDRQQGGRQRQFVERSVRWCRLRGKVGVG